MTRRSGIPHDPTAENGLRLAAMRDDLLGRFFDDALTDREKVVVVAALCYLASPDYLPGYRLNQREAQELETLARSKLREHGLFRPLSDGLDQYIVANDRERRLEQQRRDIWDDRAPVKSNLIQALAEELREFRGACGHCGEEMWRWRSQYGRGRSYCSNACRQAAYRNRCARAGRGAAVYGDSRRGRGRLVDHDPEVDPAA